MPDDRLSLAVTHSDGTVTRWGRDEADAGDIPGDLTFSTSVPGGFTSLSCSLLREIQPRADEYLFDTVRAYGPGNQTAWEGRIAQLPRAGGRSARLEPGAVGWSSHLEDDQSFREVYVDLGPASWGEIPLARKITHSTGGISMGDMAWSVDSGVLTLAYPNQALGAATVAEIAYASPAGVKIGQITYSGVHTSFPAGWIVRITASDSDGTVGDTYTPTFDNTTRIEGLATADRRYVRLFVYSNATAATPAAGALTRLTKLAVYGNHGVTLRATAVGEPDGVYASDVVADVISSAAPLLTYTTGATGTIQPTTFAIPHLAFKDPTTAADAIATTNAYHGWDWAVWDNRTFYYNAAGSGTQWQARIGDGAQLSLEGDTADQIINGVIVSYQDGGLGITKLAGPVGSGCDVESASLQDSSVDNPATMHSITRKWPVLPISFPTTDAGAVQLGAIYLAERNLASRKGTLTLSGSVRHPTEGMVPCWRVRAGDTVTVSDQAGSPVRRIIATSYSHSQRQTVLTLDSTAHKLDALLSRLLSVTSALS